MEKFSELINNLSDVPKSVTFFISQKLWLWHQFYDTCFCIRTLELANSIDSTENLANSKVFLVHGADDTIVDPLFAKKIEAYYEGFNVDMNAKAQYIKQTVRP